MKNITQYFMDTIKANDSLPVHSNSTKKKEIESRKYSKDKYNYTTVEISKKNSGKDTCNMIESSSDIIDRNSNPFKEINIYQTSKQYFSSKLSSTKLQKHVDLSLETNDVLNINKKQIKNDSIHISTDKKRYIKKSKRGENINSDTHVNDMYKSTSTNLLNVQLSDEIKSTHEESNAFQILMSHNNLNQCSTPIKDLTENELNARKPEEHGEQFICSTDRLINEKRKSLKRKISQIENEKIEKIIQNPVKFLKKEEKKDNSMDISVVGQKQASSNLLNYFSKTSVNLTNTNMADISTILVKADVHMSQNSIEHDLHNAVSSNAISSNKRRKTSSLQFSEVDSISVVESEIIDIPNNEKKQKYQELNKGRWSLRIKFQTREDENTSLGEISDGELLSSKSKTKLNTESSKKSKINRGLYSENLQIRDKSNKEISKRINEHTKLKLRKCEQPENLLCNVTIQNDKCERGKFEHVHEITKSDKFKSTLKQNKNFDDCIIVDVKGNSETKSNQECCVISHENNSEKKTTSKLAPIFTKQRKANQKEMSIKQLHAQTNINDNDNKNMNQQINVCSTLSFPLISHITQLNNLDCNEKGNINFLQKVSNKLYIPNLNVKYYKQVVDFSEIKLKKLKNINQSKIEEALTDIEKSCSDVKKMWSVIALTVKRHSHKTVSPKTKSRKNKQVKKIGMTEHIDNENQIENFSWTYKYRPKSTQEVVGNEKAAIKLREWLVGWKLTFINEDSNSGDEFYSSDSSYSKNNKNNQVAVLLGPHGSGKTASVYAVAEEFGYTVLELNASSKRTGKKLLKELEEATKSYQIKKKERVTSLCNLNSDKIIPKKISKNSLILIEDVDIIFEEDEGFISAICQLASNTKRPIVMTCKDVCPHLNKLAPQQSRIFFQSPVGNKVSVLLELISLAETGYRLSSSCITELLQSGDLRKAILQLQYLLLSGPPQMSEQFINFKNSFWQNMQYHVYRPAIKFVVHFSDLYLFHRMTIAYFANKNKGKILYRHSYKILY
ncbi:enhanced level of genomic instability 1 isoform X2 [Megachile rotundata]|uniref:enhanced level of genomic instability 1 isoform X2 n=1 Tax=Megachile rotundata TaxID=143995 RepID=UPI003FD0256C